MYSQVMPTCQRILFINPYTGGVRRKANVPPVRVGYLAGIVREEGYDVEILDMKLHCMGYIERFLKKKDFDVIIIHVGLSFTNLSGSCYLQSLEILETVKSSGGEYLVGLAGQYATIMGKAMTDDQIVRDTVDFVIFSEGEAVLGPLLSAFNSGHSLATVPGILYRDSDDWKKNPAAPEVNDLNTLPTPAYDLMEMSRYRNNILWTSRGCPFECIFCSTPIVYNKKYRYQSPDTVVDDMVHIIDHYGDKVFWIVDDYFFLHQDRVEAICDSIILRNLKVRWCVTAGARGEGIGKQLLAKMKRAGCAQLGFGVESGNEEVLRNLGKNVSIEKIKEITKNAQEVGIAVQYYFMIGNPGETLKYVKDTMNLIWEVIPQNVIFFESTPYQGSQLYEWVEKHGRLLRPPYGDIFAHHNNYKIEEPYFETDDFTREERISALRKCLALKMAFYKFPRLIYAIIKFLSDNRFRYFTDIFLITKNWIKLRLIRRRHHCRR
ncbi:B12-binding domain-containing radical SAM protein [Candidatus Latescibacterota bacterium]